MSSVAETVALLENVNPAYRGYGRKSSNTLSLEERGLIMALYIHPESSYWFAELTADGRTYLLKHGGKPAYQATS